MPDDFARCTCGHIYDEHEFFTHVCCVEDCLCVHFEEVEDEDA